MKRTFFTHTSLLRIWRHCNLWRHTELNRNAASTQTASGYISSWIADTTMVKFQISKQITVTEGRVRRVTLCTESWSQWPWKTVRSSNRVFSDFFSMSARLRRTIQQQIAPKLLEMDRDNLHVNFAAQNVVFNRLKFDLLSSRSPPYRSIIIWAPFQTTFFLLNVVDVVGGPKNVPLYFCPYFCQQSTYFENSFTDAFCG